MAARAARIWLALAGLSGALAVAAGAWGAHGLAADPAAADVFDTGVRYHMWHALALFGVGALAAAGRGGAALNLAGAAFVLGTVLFSGGLYVLALTGAGGAAMIAPAGGVSFILGWLALAAHALRARR